MNGKPVGILGTGKYVPERILTNSELETMVDTNDEWIVTRTGIRERRIVSPEQVTSDLAFHAAQEALVNAGISADQLDLIVVATVTPDMAFPSTACILQEKLGAKNSAAFDISAACSGFIYALNTAVNFIANEAYRYVLVVGADCLSRLTDYTDRNTCILFGDGAGATVIGPAKEGRGFRSFVLGADGTGSSLLKVIEAKPRNPSTPETVDRRLQYIYMEGSEVFKFAVRIMGNAAEEALEKAGISKDKVDLFVPHQANQRIIQSALTRLDLTPDKCMLNLEKYGNMSAASIPVALAEAVELGRVKDGDCLVLVGFGGGLTWAASVLIW